jgi:hypothetical protein
MAILYPDEITYDYLRALYTPYRTALPDPTVLPLEDDIMWNEFIGGPKDTSFIVSEDFQQPKLFALGGGTREWNTSLTIYVMTLWTQGGKPPYLKEFSKFLEKYLLVKPTPPPTIRTAGITEFTPIQFQITQGVTSFRGFGTFSNIQNPETDWWALAVNVRTKYFQPANTAP